jgi:hypothetical protein
LALIVSCGRGAVALAVLREPANGAEANRHRIARTGVQTVNHRLTLKTFRRRLA